MSLKYRTLYLTALILAIIAFPLDWILGKLEKKLHEMDKEIGKDR